MHSRRLNWLTSAIGSTWPLINGANVPAQAAGTVVSNEYGNGERLILPNGLRVYVDNNIPTAEVVNLTERFPPRPHGNGRYRQAGDGDEVRQHGGHVSISLLTKPATLRAAVTGGLPVSCLSLRCPV